AVVVLGRNQFQRVFAAQLLVAVARFYGRRVAQGFGMEMALAIGGAETASGEGQERRAVFGAIFGQAEADEMLAIQLFERDSFDKGMRRIEQRANRLVIGIAQARVVKTHPLGQQAEDLASRFGFAGLPQTGARELLA